MHDEPSCYQDVSVHKFKIMWISISGDTADVDSWARCRLNLSHISWKNILTKRSHILACTLKLNMLLITVKSLTINGPLGQHSRGLGMEACCVKAEYRLCIIINLR